MKRKILNLSFFIVLVLSLNVNAATTHTFQIDFDNVMDDVLIEPYVASGTFIFEYGDLKLDGEILLSAMTSYSFEINFWEVDNDTNILYKFTTEDIIPNIGTSGIDAIVVFSEYGRFVTLKEASGASSSYGGSLNFLDASTSTTGSNVVLNFGDSNNPNKYIMFSGDVSNVQYNGNYGSTAVPVPAALWLFGSGIAGLALLRKRSF